MKSSQPQGEIMTPANKRWEEFAERLEGKEGCNFRYTIKGDPKSVTWSCTQKRSKPFARAILKKMGNIDIRKTMKFFDANGGHCDCEILFNIAK